MSGVDPPFCFVERAEENDATVLPYKRQIDSLPRLEPEERAGLARILKKTLIRYDNLFQCVRSSSCARFAHPHTATQNALPLLDGHPPEPPPHRSLCIR